MIQKQNIIQEMNERSKIVFRNLVDSYIETGEPVGSQTLANTLAEEISPATIRNVMQDLEVLGLLDSPHVSSGRIPTQQGLRLFVDTLLEIGEISNKEQEIIDYSIKEDPKNLSNILTRAGSVLSGLTKSASLVLAPKIEAPIKHIEFVSLSPERALAVLVTADGMVENRVFEPPLGQTQSDFREAANFMNAYAKGLTLSELREVMEREVSKRKLEIDKIAAQLVKDGLAVWDGKDTDNSRLIVRGRANLIDGTTAEDDFEKIRELFDDLERKQDIANFINLTEKGEGVRVFIGSENKLFSLSGSSLVISPYMNSEHKIIGAVGVIGPTRLNYGKIVPIVDYTAQLVGRTLSERG
ncbi:MAG: heat-inducible transcriptional repressor HrcA [Rhodobacteraceae bacterium]|jgi:heat-inducible transcriptional repressor|nr:heat-inducible transcriptional repressor HrcA [Paracoccaceae bacterium]MBT4777984.1 heat-inducible transcriptional repressor HrcA [Paracoccaceae bacterium]MDA9122354.1 heat-inducible transcriptional repressor HrcA [Paracoccaceae bacterium]MDE2693758.1 heat-inducible transcriptional repressor HrcA [Paracoccaceae bacterium]|tara:strand:- start:786 stop:1850 length:1065 start_codon:yes stop_codon:yes gene_type:complete